MNATGSSSRSAPRQRNTNKQLNSTNSSGGSVEVRNESTTTQERTSPPSNNSHSHGNHSSPLPARTISQLRSAAIAHPQQQCVLTCYIPPSRVGAVIGRRGTTIIHIQKEAVKKSWSHGGQVRVSIVSQGNNNSGSNSNSAPPASGMTPSGSGHSNSDMTSDVQSGGSFSEGKRDLDGGTNGRSEMIDETALWTPVIIRGDPCGAIAAAKLLLPLLTTNPPASDDDVNESDVDYSADMDDVVLDIPIHRSRHAAIIGKKGLTIASLSADHDVRIMVPHRNHNINGKTSSSNNTAPSPSNINIVQLEGQLESVEKCLASMLKVVCGSHSSNNNDHNNIFNTSGNGDMEASEAPNTKEDSNANQTYPESTSSSPNPKLTITNANNQTSNSKKEPKFSEITITVPPELSYLVPSLAKIRTIGKSTNSVIRRKRLDANVNIASGASKIVTAGGSNGSSEEIFQEKVESGDDTVATSVITTQLLVNGRTECVKNAIMQLEKILTSSVTSDSNFDRLIKTGNSTEEHESGKMEANETGSSTKRKEGTESFSEQPRQKNGPGKRRPHSGRGGGRIGNKGGKKRGGSRGGSGSVAKEGTSTVGLSNTKELPA